jgi:hypothetical protein
MSRLGRFAGLRSVGPASSVDAWTEQVEAISLPRLDEVGGHPRPSNVGTSYVEQEYHALAEEQELLWRAEGEDEARPYGVQARGLDQEVAGIGFLLTQHEAEVREAHAEYQRATQVLGSYVRRESGGKLRYWICWPILVLGDTAGVWSAAIINGDVPYIAFGQALAAGLAAACAGLVGSELKDIRMARVRQRDPDSLTKEEQRYRRLFVPGGDGLGITKLMGGLSLLVATLVALGVFALRAGIEGSLTGLTFGLFALATAIASGLLGYASADEVADLLGSLAKRVRGAETRYLELARSTACRDKAASEETARSIREESAHRAGAAGKRVDSLSWQAQRRNPQVFGHGFAAGEQSGVIGRRSRRSVSA